MNWVYCGVLAFRDIGSFGLSYFTETKQNSDFWYWIADIFFLPVHTRVYEISWQRGWTRKVVNKWLHLRREHGHCTVHCFSPAACKLKDISGKMMYRGRGEKKRGKEPRNWADSLQEISSPAFSRVSMANIYHTWMCVCADKVPS